MIAGMLRNRVDSVETPIFVLPKWWWMAMTPLCSLLGISHLMEGIWWLGLGWLVLAAIIAWGCYRRVGLFHDGESVIFRGVFRVKRVPIAMIRDVEESRLSGRLVLVMRDGGRIRVWNGPEWGWDRDPAIRGIRGLIVAERSSDGMPSPD